LTKWGIIVNYLFRKNERVENKGHAICGKKQRIGSQRDSQRHENIIARDFSSSDDEVFLIEQDNNPKESFVPGGRRVVRFPW
jgi:hypothetical protein